VSDQVTQYHVYFSSNNDGKYAKIASTSETNYEYVAPLVTGAFYVTSENAKGESAPSDKQTVN
jgi:penicillin-binding protein 1B